MTGLLLVLMFVLTIFMVVQFVLRDTISGQKGELDQLKSEIALLSETLGLTDARNNDLQARIVALLAERDQQVAELADARGQIVDFRDRLAMLLDSQRRAEAEIADRDADLRRADARRAMLETLLADLRARNLEAEATGTGLREQVAALLAETAVLREDVSALETDLGEEEEARLAEIAIAEALRRRLGEADERIVAMSLAMEALRRDFESRVAEFLVARDRAEERISAQREEIERGDSRRRMLEALVADLRARNLDAEAAGTGLREQVAALLAETAALREDVSALETDLGAEEEARLAEIAIAEALRRRLGEADERIVAMSLAMEALRRDFESRVTEFLAARDRAEERMSAQREEIERGDSRRRMLEALVADLRARNLDAEATGTSLREQVAALLAETAALREDVSALETDLGAEEEARLAEIAIAEALRRRLGEADERIVAMSLAMEALRRDFESRVTEFLVARDRAEERMSAQREEIERGDSRRRMLEALVADLRARNLDAEAAGTGLREQVAALLAETAVLREDVSALETDLGAEEEARLAEIAIAEALRRRLGEADERIVAMSLAMEALRRDFESRVTEFLVARDRAEERMSAQREEIERGDSRRRMLEALVADLRARNLDAEAAGTGLREQVAALLAETAALREDVSALETDLGAEEEARLAEIAIAEELRRRLQESGAELTALSLALEAKRREAEETLTLLAVAREAERELKRLAEKELAQARTALSEQEARAERDSETLKRQLSALRGQLGELQALLDDYRERDEAARVQVSALGSRLNSALAQLAAEERKRRQLEEEERRRQEELARAALEKTDLLARQAEELARYKSEFFGRMSEILAGQEGVKVVGDRFVFSAEVLFDPGSAELAPTGRDEIRKIAVLLHTLQDEIPDSIDWVIRVDGHTDDVPLQSGGVYRDNWELSQARALSVVRHMVDELDIPPHRLAANGFGEFHPIDPGRTARARARNRRIELKLTER